MPQLDHVTYFSQYFWLCVVFFAFYGACVKFYLPGLSRLTKYRNKTQIQDSLSSKDSSSEVLDLKGRLSLPPVMENLLGASFDYSSFSESLKSLSSFASLKHIFSWRISNWNKTIVPFLKEFALKKACEDRRLSSLVIKDVRESVISGQTSGFEGSSTKSVYLNTFDLFALQNSGVSKK
uniref:H(+)-transporting two-sector ATPase n=1 Tax=Chloropicon primus TaxID=1764295 RepID=A0A4D6C427_9CHLO|nr:ATP synthase F0 subunit 8 [Chloropicon primus]QBX98445.1 ATP synthase F0 subunit 8 [Chloropicon primus]